MSYKKRVPMIILLDSIVVLSSIFLGFFILNPSMNIFTLPLLWISSIALLLSHQISAMIYHLYQKAWEYASVGELTAIVKAVTLSVSLAGVVQLVLVQDIYFRVMGITWMLHVILIGGTRFSWRVFRDRFISPSPNMKRTLIVGAGSAGTMVARQLLRNPDADLYPIAFVDDHPKKYRLQIYGIEVQGKIKDIPLLAEELNIENIVIAIPSLQKQELKRIYEECAKTQAKTKILPMIEDLVTGRVSVSQIRDVQVEDLLGREPVELDLSSISEKVTGKIVLVTGAGGSIGSEICRQVSQFFPQKIVLVGHGENSIYTIDMELRNQFGQVIEIIPLIGDVQDRNRMFEIMEEHKPNVVYHAAAHKHVPLMEYNPREAVKNNVFGTKNVAEAADKFRVETFVLISSDKAVNPTNIMGSTKRIAEMIIQRLDQNSQTKFVAVRFGNVLGSRGSVIPLFKKQIQAGGPVTVTHPDMTRYFMTIPEASRLVIQAGTLARGGEIFVLDMGEPVKITDLAKNLIRLSGYTIEEIGINYSGLRPGEKMFEELLNEREIYPEPIFPKIFIGKAVLEQEEEVNYLLERFENFDSKQLKDFVINLANRRENRFFLVAK
ncbi:polysaccharide biosynthesis protein [Mesobacillus jeotgali]|uniref:polysaccharide biosynthesis protein n=1 Tax=Mesobacillus jeotgali TaxID=129985 RepID=UPI0009A66CD0|nr:nucleoside-diphosphate sugar epimerase/dehydratase [Mesobacillus jeotgali]